MEFINKLLGKEPKVEPIIEGGFTSNVYSNLLNKFQKLYEMENPSGNSILIINQIDWKLYCEYQQNQRCLIPLKEFWNFRIEVDHNCTEPYFRKATEKETLMYYTDQREILVDIYLMMKK